MRPRDSKELGVVNITKNDRIAHKAKLAERRRIRKIVRTAYNAVAEELKKYGRSMPMSSGFMSVRKGRLNALEWLMGKLKP